LSRKQKLILPFITKNMVISEENGGFLGGGSLADQLQMPTDQPQT
jgi:hypothetical protein